jgi:hypothetical protein
VQESDAPLCERRRATESMLSTLKTCLDIALLRRDPSDLPASPPLLGAMIVLFLVLNSILSSIFRPEVESWFMQLLASVAFSILWYWMLLRLFGKPERFLQTMTAIVGFGCLITPVLVPLTGMIAPYAAKPEEAAPLVLVLLPVAIYVVYVTARILRAAIERPMFQAVALVLLQTFLEPLILLSLFPPPQAS